MTMMDCPVCHENVLVIDKADIKAHIRTHSSGQLFHVLVRLCLRWLVTGSFK